ncbi:uncharacterized protein KQ657_002088 [Scheffersomyces spartinae]|uniref:ATPase expression protein 1 n=1 Tax=Scheffersomyces spartinae TaxID=45513 RepID=A0A9P8AKB1_9ASCO|nr:uncharacterized protein KQ657_002088 [Scheffersomyces spartinae]KAG7195706.1 hypothetical protein KQ657_002088 [Scheffersomyces spartinae]
MSLSRRGFSTVTGLRNGGLHMFLPNETQYVFKGERLTPQENIRAIPSKPPLQPQVKKFYNDITRPDQTGDVIKRFTLTDVITTCLASNSLVDVVKGDGGAGIELYFTPVVTKWMNDFNNLVLPLEDISSTEPPTFYRYKAIEDLQLEVPPEGITSQWLNEIISSNKIVHNSTLILQGKLLPMEATKLPTFELLMFWLLSHETIGGLNNNITVLMSFIEQHFDLIPLASLETMVDCLVHYIHGLEIVDKGTFEHFNTIVQHALVINASLYTKMSPIMADTLAFEYIRGNNVQAARQVLISLVQDAKLAPTPSTVDAFLKTCFAEDVSFLKPVFFHRNSMTPDVILFLITHRVHSVSDLNKLVELLESYHGKETLNQYQYQLFECLCRLPITEVHLTQMIKRLVIENSVKLNDLVIELIDNQYSSLNSHQSLSKIL